MKRTLLLSFVAGALAIALACTEEKAAPLAPSGGASAGTTSADSPTLKATAPVPVSPINGIKPTAGLELKITNSTTEFTSSGPLSYRFEIYTSSGTRVYQSGLIPAGTGTTSLVPSATLTTDQQYQWQARAEYQGAFGPWSARASFIASITSGYFKGTEIYDPLIDGKSVGTIHGPVTFIPGVGLRFDSDEAYVEYLLPTYVSAGEFSAMVSNLNTDSPDENPKYRVLTMREGQDAINDNPYRMSVDKRGNGAVAYRFLTGPNLNYIESGPADRVQLPFHESLWYFWKVTWGHNTFTFNINENSANGPSFYSLSRGYDREYTPDPHNVYLGSPFKPGDRGEPSSVEDMIVKQVWFSTNPRPAFANQ